MLLELLKTFVQFGADDILLQYCVGLS